MKTEENKKSAQAIEEEGSKVSGGAETPQNNSQKEESGATSSGEHDSSQVGEKDKMSGYNSLPDQEKVGE
ncbi:hypothetical protein ACFSKU_02005 [Pontibacter silvestris]|uniref:Uncharacterized protein n=1 Tax=Pontibacter silvestris TaxID=2305183 RepID=A0ABW4WSE0_9BACT|nr:hypothetical protein [Pontibacter silvestris]MCC9137819.1 hypothetical protein [Pontibacter silvestris]